MMRDFIFYVNSLCASEPPRIPAGRDRPLLVKEGKVLLLVLFLDISI